MTMTRKKRMKMMVRDDDHDDEDDVYEDTRDYDDELTMLFMITMMMNVPCCN